MSRQRAAELELSENELVIARDQLDGLHDDLYVLACAVDADQAAAIGNQTGGRVGFFLQTDDFARDHAAMLDNGVIFEEAPRAEPYGTVAVWRDPFGNRWDLIEFAAS